MAKSKKTTTTQPEEVTPTLAKETTETPTEGESVAEVKETKATKKSKVKEEDVVTIYSSILTLIDASNVIKVLKDKGVKYKTVNSFSKEGREVLKECNVRGTFAVVFNDGVLNIVATTWRDALKKLKDNGKI